MQEQEQDAMMMHQPILVNSAPAAALTCGIIHWLSVSESCGDLIA